MYRKGVHDHHGTEKKNRSEWRKEQPQQQLPSSVAPIGMQPVQSV